MRSINNVRVKICCMSSQQEALLAIKYGATAIGLVSQMPSGPGIVSDEMIIDILKVVPKTISTFLLTCETQADQIALQLRKLGANTVQLVDFMEETEFLRLRRILPDVSIVQVIHVQDESSIDQAVRVSKYADMLLLDSGDPNSKIKILGGTGKTHNWQISRKIVEAVSIPVFLAGGLNSENVRKAIETVSPYGVDLCSGVRTNGMLDEAKLESFFNEVNKVSY